VGVVVLAILSVYLYGYYRRHSGTSKAFSSGVKQGKWENQEDEDAETTAEEGNDIEMQ
jgi:hypothetical protein